MMTNLEALNAHEAEAARISAMINKLGREVAAIVGIELVRERYYKSGRYEDFSFDGYARTRMEEFHAKHDKLPYAYREAGEDENWEEIPAWGEPLIVAKYVFYIGDGCEVKHVYFPESYLDDPDWQSKEREYARICNEANQQKADAAAAEHERNLRAQYESLRKRFGDDT